MLFANRFRTPLSISFAFVATHNHFVLDRGGKVFNRSAPIIKLPREVTSEDEGNQSANVFKQSAPIIKLPTDASEDDHLALLGLLNSSLACFWMKQVFYPKSTAVKDIDAEGGKPESNRFEFAVTGMLSFPIPSEGCLRQSRVVHIAREIDALASKSGSLKPQAILKDWCLDAGLTHHNSESGLAGKPCLLVKSKLLAHIFATFR